MKRNENSFVILIPGFAESETDTTCLPMQQAFVRCLSEQHPELRIIVLAFQYPYVIRKYRWLGIEVMSFSGKNKGGFRRFFLRRKLFSVLRDINKENKIGGILSFWYGECAWVGKMFADRYDIPHRCWIMGQDARSENAYVQKTKLAPDHLIALSDFLQEEFQRNHHVRPTHVIPAAIDPREFSKNEPMKDIDVLGAGSLIPLKQFQVFLEIIASLKKRLPTIRAMIIGNGPEKARLNEKIAELELSGNVTMQGEVSHPEVLQCMRRARVFLHPSNYEGFSGVCLEAIYAGAQVISFAKPMRTDIEGWKVAASLSEMTQLAESLLNTKEVHRAPLHQFLMQDTVEKIMRLYKID